MKYAETIMDITNTFKNGPLDENELKKFYCGNTMEFRTGDKYSSPILDIYEACQILLTRMPFYCWDTRGAGKVQS